jgi:hypothetical protein
MDMDSRESVWAAQQYGKAALGDARLSHRLVLLVAWILVHMGKSFADIFKGDAAMKEAAYRFLRNDNVSWEAVAEAGFQATVRRALETPGALLAIQDSTGISFDHAASGLGDLGGLRMSSNRGFFCHSSLLVEAQTGAVLGLADQMYWARPPEQRGTKADHKLRDYQDKESFKWEASSVRMRERLGPVMQRVVQVCDRESDVHEYLMDCIGHDLRFVVRAVRDRRLTSASDKLFESARNGAIRAEGTVAVPARPGRKARDAKVELRSCTVTVKHPNRQYESLPDLELNAVLVQELKPPSDKDRLEWLLLTTEPVDTAEDSVRIAHWYARRWLVEVFHYTWKSGGTNVEGLQMHSVETLMTAAVLLALAAVGILQLRDALSSQFPRQPRLQPSVKTSETTCPPLPPRPCTDILTDLEWQVLWIKTQNSQPPSTVPDSAWACLNIAKLGGWPAGKTPPGVHTVWAGRVILFQLAIGALIGAAMVQSGWVPPKPPSGEL